MSSCFLPGTGTRCYCSNTSKYVLFSPLYAILDFFALCNPFAFPWRTCELVEWGQTKPCKAIRNWFGNAATTTTTAPMGFHQQVYSFVDANITMCTYEQHGIDGSYRALRQLNVCTAAWSFGWWYNRRHVQPKYHAHQRMRKRFERHAILVAHTSATHIPGSWYGGQQNLVSNLLHKYHKTASHLQ